MEFEFDNFSKICLQNSNFTKVLKEQRALCMKPTAHLLLYFPQFFLEWEMFQTKVSEKIKSHILCSITFFFFQKSFLLWDNVEKLCTAGQATDYNMRMRIACWIPRYTHRICNNYIPLQQWSHEHATMLRYDVYVYCLSWTLAGPCIIIQFK